MNSTLSYVTNLVKQKINEMKSDDKNKNKSESKKIN